MTKVFITVTMLFITSSYLYAGACMNGLYIDNDYIAKKKPARFYTTLSNKIKNYNLTDLYIKVYPQQRKLEKNIKEFIAKVNNISPKVRVHGWIGKRVCTAKKKNLCFSFTNKKQVKYLINHIKAIWGFGFHAVHLNFEPVLNGNSEFIKLLNEINKIKPKGKILSLASYMIKPDKKNQNLILPNKDVFYWDKAYIKKIIPHVNHLMVMNYDTAHNVKENYIALTKYQTTEFITLTKGTKTELRIGIPSYQFGRTGFFNRKIETLENAITGIKHAINDSCPVNFGVSIYNDSETTLPEWNYFKENIVNKTN